MRALGRLLNTTINLEMTDATAATDATAEWGFGWRTSIWVGVILVAIYTSSIFFIVRSFAQTARKSHEHSLHFKENGLPVVFEEPRMPRGQHIFLSHVWRYGQRATSARTL